MLAVGWGVRPPERSGVWLDLRAIRDGAFSLRENSSTAKCLQGRGGRATVSIAILSQDCSGLGPPARMGNQ